MTRGEQNWSELIRTLLGQRRIRQLSSLPSLALLLLLLYHELDPGSPDAICFGMSSFKPSSPTLALVFGMFDPAP